MTLPQELLAQLLVSVRDIAARAGEAILPIAAELNATDVTLKRDGSPLTRADQASEAVIQTGLAALKPQLPVLSEEGDLGRVSDRDWDLFWCVDPLDGTKEFIQGRPEYTVNIALVHQARPTLGVVHVPASGLTYFAAAGQGAFRAVRGGPDEPIRPGRADRPRRAVVSRSHLDDATRAFVGRIGVEEFLSFGSSLKLCAVAEGNADIYPRFGPTCLWDTAAGAAVAVEAGCHVVDAAGKPLSYNPLSGLTRPAFLVYPRGMSIDLPM